VHNLALPAIHRAFLNHTIIAWAPHAHRFFFDDGPSISRKRYATGALPRRMLHQRRYRAPLNSREMAKCFRGGDGGVSTEWSSRPSSDGRIVDTVLQASVSRTSPRHRFLRRLVGRHLDPGRPGMLGIPPRQNRGSTVCMVRAWRASTFQYAASSPWSGEGRGEARQRWGWRWQCRQQQQRRRLVVSPTVRPSPLPEA
jgi:hypothetical protein